MNPEGRFTFLILRPLNDLVLWLWRLERRTEFLYRPRFDRRLRPRLFALTQRLRNGRRADEGLKLACPAVQDSADTLTFGTIGNGSLAHLTMTLMQKAGGFRVVHVPYRGGGPMSAAAAAGELDLPMATNAGLGGQVGQSLRPLAQTGARRSPRFPDLPTAAEAGIAGIDALAWWGALAPARTPEPILRRFHAALRDALGAAEVRARIADPLGIDLVASAPEEFAAFLDAQMETWGRVVRENNIRPD